MKPDGKTMRTYSLILLMLLLLLPMAGCSTDSNLGGLNPSCIEFSPDPSGSTGNDVVVVDWVSDCDVVTLAFYYRPTAETPNVWSADFEIHFPFGIVIPDDQVGTTFLLADGETEVLSILGTDVTGVAQLVAPGIVEFGITKIGDLDGAEPIAGDNNLLGTFAFGRIATQGSGTVELIDGTIRSKMEEFEPVAIPGITFFGGEFDIDN